MKKGESVNPLIPGEKVVGIFAFCDIRNFTDMTEILQEKVMVFVNSIAKIVHTNGIIFFYYTKFIIYMDLLIKMLGMLLWWYGRSLNQFCRL
jgi:hypothetical protein